MRTLSMYSFRKPVRCVVLIALAYSAIQFGVPPPVICLLLLAGLALRLAGHCIDFIGGVIRIAVKAAGIILFLSLFM